MLAGDTHGIIENVWHKIEHAKRVGGIQRIVILGDFGYWWRYEGVQFLDGVNDLAKSHNLQIFAIPGNHEWHEKWDSDYAHAPKSHGWGYVRTHVLIAPKVLDFVWCGKQFVVAGGAVSIDKDYRLQYEREKGKRIWSPNEQLRDEQVDALLATRFGGGAPVDYLLTHDCSDATPWKHSLKPDIESQIHRGRIDRVLKGIKPKMHFHGHMHERYDWENRVGGDEWVSTKGLMCDRDTDSWGILDLKTDEFTFASDLED